MMPAPLPPPLLRAWYRVLLLIVPSREREAIGADMEAVFAVSLAEERRRRGRWGWLSGAGRSAWDLLAFAMVARRDERRRRHPGVSSTGPSSEPRMNQVGRFFTNLGQDARFAGRLLLKDRSFTITALLTLAICIGANTAIFSIVRSVVLKPLPVPNADRIVMFHNNYPNAGATHGSTGVPDYFDRKAQTDVFDELAVYRHQGFTLGGKDGAVRLTGIRATPSFFRLVSAKPTLGRIFTESEGEVGQDKEVILSAGLWQREFGGSRDVLGKPLLLSGTSYQIVGVLPADFRYLWNDIDVYVPASFADQDKADTQRHSNNWEMIGLRKAGVPISRAQEEIDAINRHNEDRFPQFTKLLHDAGFYTAVADLQTEVVEDVRPVLFLLWGGVLFVLLIGCLNIANLVLVRSSGRTRELATRQAIGAGIGRLSRQLLTETTLLSIAGGILGLGLGWWALKLVPSLGLDDMPRGHEIALDPVSASVVLAVALVVGVLIGLMPAIRTSRLNVNGVLREEGRGGTASRSTNFVRRALATAQITIAFVLLIGAGLLLSSFREVLRIDPGFVSTGVVTGAITLPSTSYKDEAVVPFITALLEGVRAIPGVHGAAVTSTVPLAGDHSDSVVIAEDHKMKEGESLVSPNEIMVSDGYFETMGTRLVRGRFFDTHDTAAGQLVAVIDDRLASHFWPDKDPIGRRFFKPEGPEEVLRPGADTKYYTVVGVVKEVQFDGLATERTPVGAVYYSFAQRPVHGFGLTVKSSSASAAVVSSIRKTIAAIDPALPFYAVRTMDDYVSQSLMSRRVPVLLAGAFAVVALLLSAIGIYGVLAYGVAQRRREIGIRLALGSTGGAVFGLVVKEGLRIVLIGLALGFVGLFALRHALVAVLYGVTPFDPTVIASVAIALGLVALLAMSIPARRASRVSPVVALTD
jgi:predicted permease